MLGSSPTGASMLPSSNGLGYMPLTHMIPVQIWLVVPDFATETYNRPNPQILRRVAGLSLKYPLHVSLLQVESISHREEMNVLVHIQ